MYNRLSNMVRVGQVLKFNCMCSLAPNRLQWALFIYSGRSRDLRALTFVYVTALHGAECVHLVAAAAPFAFEHLGHDLRLCRLTRAGRKSKGVGYLYLGDALDTSAGSCSSIPFECFIYSFLWQVLLSGYFIRMYFAGLHNALHTLQK